MNRKRRSLPYRILLKWILPLVVIFFCIGLWSIRTSSTFKLVFECLGQSRTVKSKLGRKIKEGILVYGKVGSFPFITDEWVSFTVRGVKGSARVRGDVSKNADGVRKIEEIKIVYEDGKIEYLTCKTKKYGNW